MAKRSKRVPTDAVSTESLNNPFAVLANMSAPIASVDAQSRQVFSRPDSSRTRGATAESPFAGKLILRRTRKGHGGKTVTLLQGLAMGEPELSALARQLGKALGCGARVDGSDICVAGDQCTRLEAWLRERGAVRIVLGGG